LAIFSTIFFTSSSATDSITQITLIAVHRWPLQKISKFQNHKEKLHISKLSGIVSVQTHKV
jgi:hypothetical protein